MHRTQVYLEEAHYQALRSRARREGKTIAALIREMLDRYLAPGGAAGGPDPFDRVIGVGKGDGAAVAENYEEYLYGGKI
ncbi:MAG: ribbon-helix-helix domain-containing protein [Planctomycetes bacterium]|nr:ribbon-helix-helix domain-containing protein [Planctomycetota bacterium]